MLLFALPGIGLIAALAKRSYDQERASASRHLVSTTRAVAVLIERKFEAMELLLRGLAALPALAEDDLDAFEAILRSTPTNRDEWIVLLRPDGQQLINTRVSTDHPLPKVEMTEDFWAAARRGERHVSNVFVGAVVKAPVLTLSIPMSEQGELKYVLVLVMLPEALARAVAPQQITSSDLVAILDRNGVIAVRSHNPERYVGQKARPDLVAAAAARPHGVIESVTLDGIPTLTAFSRSAALGWTAAIGAPRAEIYASARSLLRMAAVWTGAVILLAGLTAGWIGRTVVRGMDLLVADTQIVGAGELPRHRRTGLHEVDVVAHALGSTASTLHLRERELRQINQTLEQRVAARTRELESANRELEDFARVAAHDLRQPLRSMISFAELLRDDHGAQLDPAARDYLDRVCAAAHRLNGLLEAILAYSTASAAPLAQFQPVDLDDILTAVKHDLADRLQQTKGQILGRSLGTDEGDPQQIHQLLLNLIGNGLKFHRPGVPPIVKLESRRDREWLHLTVADNGIGFNPAAAERIFAPFERLERKIEGSGIGLAIVRRIAERHGGSVTARSEPGVGSQFEVRFPLPAATGTFTADSKSSDAREPLLAPAGRDTRAAGNALA